MSQENKPAPDYKPEAGQWRLTSPSGNSYFADSPIKCLQAEQHDRIPADVAMARIWAAVDEDSEQLGLVHVARGHLTSADDSAK